MIYSIVYTKENVQSCFDLLCSYRFVWHTRILFINALRVRILSMILT